jgi:hypothetical protein
LALEFGREVHETSLIELALSRSGRLQ